MRADALSLDPAFAISGEVFDCAKSSQDDPFCMSANRSAHRLVMVSAILSQGRKIRHPQSAAISGRLTPCHGVAEAPRARLRGIPVPVEHRPRATGRVRRLAGHGFHRLRVGAPPPRGRAVANMRVFNGL